MLDAGAGAGTGAVRLCRGGVPAGEGYRPAHTFATAADRQTVRRFLCGASALLVLALTVLGVVLWRQRRFWR
ncbi:MAG: hypothetical protein ACLUIR_07370 [Faecalibacterium prausnitzii]